MNKIKFEHLRHLTRLLSNVQRAHAIGMYKYTYVYMRTPHYGIGSDEALAT